MARMFADALVRRIKELGTPCMVGLDPDLAKMPDKTPAGVLEFCTTVIDAVHDLVPAVKPQSAYFERLGSAGAKVLADTMSYARARGLLVLLDAKRGDIGSTAQAYAEAYLAPGTDLEADALTVNPYLGMDTLEPFVDACARHGKGLFVLCKTSNPGSGDLQDRSVDGRPVYELVADLLAPRMEPGHEGYASVGVVVGGTYPQPARVLRKKLPRTIFLVPGFGAQGGDMKDLRTYFNADGLGAIVNSSRAILYPKGPWSKDAVRAAAVEFVTTVRAAL
jgi:orotidine-5'-phosphate decarboxylase